MKLWAVYGGFGLFVVRAATEDDARRVSVNEKDGLGQYEGPDCDPADVQVEVLPTDGPEAVLAEHYG